MDQPWIDMAKELPAIAAFIYLVRVFLSHIKENQEVIKEVIDRNSEAFDRTTEMLGHASAVFGKPNNNQNNVPR